MSPVLGSLKARCTVTPSSPPSARTIAMRIGIGDGRVLVTTPGLYERKVAGIRDKIPGLAHVVLVGEDSRRAPASMTGPRLSDRRRPTSPFRRPTRGHGPAAFYQRTTGKTQGRDPRACGRRRASCDRSLCARPA